MFLEVIASIVAGIEASLRAGGKIRLAGNGGSAGDAHHIAGLWDMESARSERCWARLPCLLKDAERGKINANSDSDKSLE